MRHRSAFEYRPPPRQESFVWNYAVPALLGGIIGLGLVLLAGCLTGCTVTPTPAHRLFGTSNPKSTIKIPGYGTVELATDVQTTIGVDKKPDGALKVDIQFDSRASSVIDAEGNRVPAMTPGIQGNLAWAAAATQMNHQTADKALDLSFGLAQQAMPILAARLAQQPGAGGAARGNDERLERIEAAIDSLSETIWGRRPLNPPGPP